MTTSIDSFDETMRRGGETAIRNVSSFFRRDDALLRTLESITSRLNEIEAPFALAGGLAMVAYGCPRTTLRLELVVTSELLTQIHDRLIGAGYSFRSNGSRSLRDDATKVRIDFLVTGEFATDGEQGDVKIPHPKMSSILIDGRPYLKLEPLIDIKLIRGMVRASNLNDLADVQELIRALKLPKSYAEKLDRFVRTKFLELWDAVSNSTAVEEL